MISDEKISPTMSTADESRRYILTILTEEGQYGAPQNAVVRTIAEYRALDAILREEGIHVPPFLASAAASPDERSLQVYLQALLDIPKVVHSSAFASFLAVIDEDQEEQPPDLEYVQYLLPGIQSPKFEPIPRLGSYQRTIGTILPGWWLVWYLSLQGETTADFCIFTCANDKGSGEQQALVHHETYSASSRANQRDGSSYFGSYRVLSEPKSALLKVTGRSIMTSGGNRKVFVDCAAIPHQAFTAACTAANDANASAKRRRQAPLLSLILDNLTQIRVCVQEEGREEEELTLKAQEQQNLVAMDQLAALSDQVEILEQQASKLGDERDQIKSEFAASRILVKDMKETLAMAESERRVWNMVRSELQSELSRLSQALEREKSEKARAVEELQESRQDLQEMSGRLKLLELQSSTTACGSSNEAENELAKLSTTMRKLEIELKTETKRNQALQTSIEKIEQCAKERVVKARDEAHQAKMGKRSLEFKVRQLEEENRRIRSHDQAKDTSPPVSKRKLFRALEASVANFQHPDPRLNDQLSTLRDRHHKLNVILAQNPNNNKNVEVLGMLEKAIRDIVASGKA